MVSVITFVMFDCMVIFGALGDFIFFFKQKTAYEILTCDWSSDVCSSDLFRRSTV